MKRLGHEQVLSLKNSKTNLYFTVFEVSMNIESSEKEKTP